MLKPLDTSDWSRQDIIREASMQSAALARLGVWKRLAYSLVAIGFILGLWGANTSNTAAMVGGVACLVIGGIASVVLTVGTSRGKKNVEAMLTAAGIDVDELLKPRSKADVERARAEKNGKTR